MLPPIPIGFLTLFPKKITFTVIKGWNVSIIFGEEGTQFNPTTETNERTLAIAQLRQGRELGNSTSVE